MAIKRLRDFLEWDANVPLFINSVDSMTAKVLVGTFLPILHTAIKRYVEEEGAFVTNIKIRPNIGFIEIHNCGIHYITFESHTPDTVQLMAFRPGAPNYRRVIDLNTSRRQIKQTVHRLIYY